MEYTIKPQNTAISTGVSNGTRYIANNFNKHSSVLDFGAGKMRNTMYLINAGFKEVDIYDIPAQINKLPIFKVKNINAFSNISEIYHTYDIIICSFVLNVIEDITFRKDIILNLEKLLKINGTLIIEVRKGNFLKELKHFVPYKDGFLIGNGKIKTFQKPYTLNEIKEFINQNSFNKLEIISEKQKNDSIFLEIKKII